MNGGERLLYLISYLLKERGLENMDIPKDETARKLLFRGLMNERPPKDIDDDFLREQDIYLREELRRRPIVRLSDTEEMRQGLRLYQGDITLIEADAIVNAANSALLGCFIPNHRCIDNAIHSAAGIGLRLACRDIMVKQNAPEKTGSAKITPAFNLPSKYVIHTVGPYIEKIPDKADITALASCYGSCLEIAMEHCLKSIAFCCISTGEYRFPNELAAEIAVKTVQDFINAANYKMDVIFCVFKDIDYEIYKRLLR